MQDPSTFGDQRLLGALGAALIGGLDAQEHVSRAQLGLQTLEQPIGRAGARDGAEERALGDAGGGRERRREGGARPDEPERPEDEPAEESAERSADESAARGAGAHGGLAERQLFGA